MLLVTVMDHNDLALQMRYACEALLEWYTDHKDEEGARNPPKIGKKRVRSFVLL